MISLKEKTVKSSTKLDTNFRSLNPRIMTNEINYLLNLYRSD
jgi:hypothetical protein